MLKSGIIDIMIDKHTIFYKHYFNNGIKIISDLFDEKGILYCYDSFLNVYNLNTNFLEFNSLITTVRCYLKKCNFDYNSLNNSYFD